MSIRTHMTCLGSALLDFVYPPHCPTCNAYQSADDREPLCRDCSRSLQNLHQPSHCGRCWAPLATSVQTSSCPNCLHWQDTHFERALVLTDFEGVAGDAIHALKFSGIKRIGPFLGRQMAANPDLVAEAASVEVLVPVPLHASRQRERGYNQAEEIARGLAGALGIELDRGCVRRCRPTRQQARLDAAERAANTAGAFEGVRPVQGAPNCIGLVDDVLTTGATLSACAAALQTESSARIIALAVASPFRRPDDGRDPLT